MFFPFPWMRLSYDGSPQKAEADESSRPQAGILSLPSLAQMLTLPSEMCPCPRTRRGLPGWVGDESARYLWTGRSSLHLDDHMKA